MKSLPLCSLETGVQTCRHSEAYQPEVEAVCGLCSSMVTHVHQLGPCVTGWGGTLSREAVGVFPVIL